MVRPFLVLAGVAAMGVAAQEAARQTLAPHELVKDDAPAPILREPPPPKEHRIDFESAEEPRLRAVVVTRGLTQPWSMAFLPDGGILVTERLGRVRRVRTAGMSGTFSGRAGTAGGLW